MGELQGLEARLLSLWDRGRGQCFSACRRQEASACRHREPKRISRRC